MSSKIHCIALFSLKGIIGIKLFKKRLKARDVTGFLVECWNKEGELFRSIDPVLIWDNATCHSLVGVHKAFKGFPFPIFPNAPYSPFLNPIEVCFSRVKHVFRHFNSLLHLENTLLKIMMSFEENNSRSQEGFQRDWLRHLMNELKSPQLRKEKNEEEFK